MIGWNLQVSNNRKVVQKQTRVNVSSRRAYHEVERVTVNVGRKVNVLVKGERVQNTR